MSVGINLPQMPREEKQAAYRADITYGTNNEYGFDYLRDNMVYEAADRVQRKLNYAIVDEVDSILIDEARTPLIISGQAEDHTAQYVAINRIVPLLKRQIGEEDPRTGEGIIEAGDFTVDEKSHQVFMTEQGHENAERILSANGLLPEGASLYDPANISLMHHLYAALRANHLYHRDQHYVVHQTDVGGVVQRRTFGQQAIGAEDALGVFMALFGHEHLVRFFVHREVTSFDDALACAWIFFTNLAFEQWHDAVDGHVLRCVRGHQPHLSLIHI